MPSNEFISIYKSIENLQDNIATNKTNWSNSIGEIDQLVFDEIDFDNTNITSGKLNGIYVALKKISVIIGEYDELNNDNFDETLKNLINNEGDNLNTLLNSVNSVNNRLKQLEKNQNNLLNDNIISKLFKSGKSFFQDFQYNVLPQTGININYNRTLFNSTTIKNTCKVLYLNNDDSLKETKTQSTVPDWGRKIFDFEFNVNSFIHNKIVNIDNIDKNITLEIYVPNANAEIPSQSSDLNKSDVDLLLNNKLLRYNILYYFYIRIIYNEIKNYINFNSLPSVGEENTLYCILNDDPSDKISILNQLPDDDTFTNNELKYVEQIDFINSLPVFYNYKNQFNFNSDFSNHLTYIDLSDYLDNEFLANNDLNYGLDEAYKLVFDNLDSTIKIINGTDSNGDTVFQNIYDLKNISDPIDSTKNYYILVKINETNYQSLILDVPEQTLVVDQYIRNIENINDINIVNNNNVLDLVLPDIPSSEFGNILDITTLEKKESHIFLSKNNELFVYIKDSSLNDYPINTYFFINEDQNSNSISNFFKLEQIKGDFQIIEEIPNIFLSQIDSNDNRVGFYQINSLDNSNRVTSFTFLNDNQGAKYYRYINNHYKYLTNNINDLFLYEIINVISDTRGEKLNENGYGVILNQDLLSNNEYIPLFALKIEADKLNDFYDSSTEDVNFDVEIIEFLKTDRRIIDDGNNYINNSKYLDDTKIDYKGVAVFDKSQFAGDNFRIIHNDIVNDNIDLDLFFLKENDFIPKFELIHKYLLENNEPNPNYTFGDSNFNIVLGLNINLRSLLDLKGIATLSDNNYSPSFRPFGELFTSLSFGTSRIISALVDNIFIKNNKNLISNQKLFISNHFNETERSRFYLDQYGQVPLINPDDLEIKKQSNLLEKIDKNLENNFLTNTFNNNQSTIEINDYSLITNRKTTPFLTENQGLSSNKAIYNNNSFFCIQDVFEKYINLNIIHSNNGKTLIYNYQKNFNSYYFKITVKDFNNTLNEQEFDLKTSQDFKGINSNLCIISDKYDLSGMEFKQVIYINNNILFIDVYSTEEESEEEETYLKISYLESVLKTNDIESYNQIKLNKKEKIIETKTDFDFSLSPFIHNYERVFSGNILEIDNPLKFNLTDINVEGLSGNDNDFLDIIRNNNTYDSNLELVENEVKNLESFDISSVTKFTLNNEEYYKIIVKVGVASLTRTGDVADDFGGSASSPLGLFKTIIFNKTQVYKQISGDRVSEYQLNIISDFNSTTANNQHLMGLVYSTISFLVIFRILNTTLNTIPDNFINRFSVPVQFNRNLYNRLDTNDNTHLNPFYVLKVLNREIILFRRHTLTDTLDSINDYNNVDLNQSSYIYFLNYSSSLPNSFRNLHRISINSTEFSVNHLNNLDYLIINNDSRVNLIISYNHNIYYSPSMVFQQNSQTNNSILSANSIFHRTDVTNVNITQSIEIKSIISNYDDTTSFKNYILNYEDGIILFSGNKCYIIKVAINEDEILSFSYDNASIDFSDLRSNNLNDDNYLVSVNNGNIIITEKLYPFKVIDFRIESNIFNNNNNLIYFENKFLFLEANQILLYDKSLTEFKESQRREISFNKSSKLFFENNFTYLVRDLSVEFVTINQLETYVSFAFVTFEEISLGFENYEIIYFNIITHPITNTLYNTLFILNELNELYTLRADFAGNINKRFYKNEIDLKDDSLILNIVSSTSEVYLLYKLNSGYFIKVGSFNDSEEITFNDNSIPIYKLFKGNNAIKIISDNGLLYLTNGNNLIEFKIINNNLIIENEYIISDDPIYGDYNINVHSGEGIRIDLNEKINTFSLSSSKIINSGLSASQIDFDGDSIDYITDFFIGPVNIYAFNSDPNHIKIIDINEPTGDGGSSVYVSYISSFDDILKSYSQNSVSLGVERNMASFSIQNAFIDFNGYKISRVKFFLNYNGIPVNEFNLKIIDLANFTIYTGVFNYSYEGTSSSSLYSPDTTNINYKYSEDVSDFTIYKNKIIFCNPVRGEIIILEKHKRINTTTRVVEEFYEEENVFKLSENFSNQKFLMKLFIVNNILFVTDGKYLQRIDFDFNDNFRFYNEELMEPSLTIQENESIKIRVNINDNSVHLLKFITGKGSAYAYGDVTLHEIKIKSQTLNSKIEYSRIDNNLFLTGEDNRIISTNESINYVEI